jgi:hypothetical protein
VTRWSETQFFLNEKKQKTKNDGIFIIFKGAIKI